ncbi:MAG TPA: outer membrane beta-barrel domain-containing protein [Polyangiales bacterium]|nr:outer membrane beta-barrel domain-containing protein [Polyangiales bacterium]
MNLSFRHGVLTSRRARAIAPTLGAFLVLAFVSGVAAQDMSFDVDEAESGTQKSEGKAGGKGKGKAKAAAPAEEAGGEAQAGGEAGGSMDMGDSGGDLLSELTAEKTDDSATAEGGLAREKESIEKIYAVQRMYVLRNGRFELAPSLAQTFNDQYVSHPSLGAGLNYWITNVLAVGVNLLWYQGIESEQKLTFSIRRSTRLAVPITEYQMGAHLNFTYVPIYGKFEMFNDSIFQWDAYLIGGVGMLRTRPVAVIDPAVRTFDFQWRVAFNAGIGLRVFVTKWLSIFGELRDYLYMEKLENLEVSLSKRGEPSTWTDQNSKLTNNVTVSLGFSMFFPFTFSYSYPK